MAKLDLSLLFVENAKKKGRSKITTKTKPQKMQEKVQLPVIYRRL